MILKIMGAGNVTQKVRIAGIKNPRITAGIKNLEMNSLLFRVVRAVLRVRI
jgi:hypothetical protein